MKVEEVTIVYGKENPRVPMLLHRCGQRYFLYNYCDIESPLREISREEAWDLLEVPESMKELLRKS